jgi:hypothetical protein
MPKRGQLHPSFIRRIVIMFHVLNDFIDNGKFNFTKTGYKIFHCYCTLKVNKIYHIFISI